MSAEQTPDPSAQPTPLPDVDCTPTEGSKEVTNETTGKRSLPIIEERLAVDQQTVEIDRFRLVKKIHQDEQIVSTPLAAEHIEIECVVIDRFVAQIPSSPQEGDTTIYHVLKEEYVIQKRLRLVEEIRVTRRTVATAGEQPIVLRREELSVKRTAPVEVVNVPIRPSNRRYRLI